MIQTQFCQYGSPPKEIKTNLDRQRRKTMTEGKNVAKQISVGLNCSRRILTRRFQIQFLRDDGCPNKRCDGARSRPTTESVAAGA